MNSRPLFDRDVLYARVACGLAIQALQVVVDERACGQERLALDGLQLVAYLRGSGRS